MTPSQDAMRAMLIYPLKTHEQFWTRRFYENPRSFEVWVPQEAEQRTELSKCVKRLEIKTILDVGCGLALDYEQYVEDGLSVQYHGIDVTLPFIEEVNRKYPCLDVRFGNVEAIPYDDGSFDAVTCRALLEHLSRLEIAFREMARVSSQYVIVTWFIPPRERVNRIEIAYRGSGLQFFKNFYSLDYVNANLREAGLNLLSKVGVGRYEIWVLEKKT